jgi:hypothetical protein
MFVAVRNLNLAKNEIGEGQFAVFLVAATGVV